MICRYAKSILLWSCWQRSCFYTHFVNLFTNLCERFIATIRNAQNTHAETGCPDDACVGNPTEYLSIANGYARFIGQLEAHVGKQEFEKHFLRTYLLNTSESKSHSIRNALSWNRFTNNWKLLSTFPNNIDRKCYEISRLGSASVTNRIHMR